MSTGFLLYLPVLLLIRAVFYYLPVRHGIIAYNLRALVETGALFLLFVLPVPTALAVPGVLLLLALFGWVIEDRLTTRPGADGYSVAPRGVFAGPAAIPGLIITVAAVAIVFSSSHAPALRGWALELTGTLTRRGLFIIAAALFVLFELGHFVPGVVSAPGRLIAYGLWLNGSLLAATIIISGSVTLDVSVASPERRRGAAIRGGASVLLAVLAALGTRWVIRSFV